MRDTCKAGLRLASAHCEQEAKLTSESADSLGELIAELMRNAQPEQRENSTPSPKAPEEDAEPTSQPESKASDGEPPKVSNNKE